MKYFNRKIDSDLEVWVSEKRRKPLLYKNNLKFGTIFVKKPA